MKDNYTSLDGFCVVTVMYRIKFKLITYPSRIPHVLPVGKSVQMGTMNATEADISRPGLSLLLQGLTLGPKPDS